MSAIASSGGPVLKRLLVPLDGSRLAECVLPVAGSLATRLQAELTLLHVMERAAPPTVHGDRHLTVAGEAEAYLAEVASRIGVPGAMVGRHVHPNEEGDVAKSIIDHAADLGADLIVLSTHGGGGARRVLFGSVAQQVLRGGTRPVLLIRPPGGPTPGDPGTFDLRRVLVPLDASPASEAALPVSQILVQRYGAEVHLLRVVPTLATISGERASAARLVPTAAAASLDLEEAEAKRHIEALASRLRSTGLRVVATVSRGEPAQGVLEEAARLGAELIVMATHGRAGIDAVFSGSVASRVMAKFPRPILLIRSPRPDPAGAA
ncbi:MAG TPA: universal stress protein [bacterium]|nr:universal stress protein [bacterium]